MVTQIVKLDDDTELHVSVSNNGIGIDHYESNMDLIRTDWIKWELLLSILKLNNYEL